MEEHAGSDKSCVWHAMDFADGEIKEEMFAIRFGSSILEVKTNNDTVTAR
jgi:Ran-binding protein 1